MTDTARWQPNHRAVSLHATGSVETRYVPSATTGAMAAVIGLAAGAVGPDVLGARPVVRVRVERPTAAATGGLHP